MKKYYIIFLILICSCSREKISNIDFPFEKKIVVYGFLGNEYGSILKIFNSAPVQDIDPQYLNTSAEAYLTENGVLVDTFHRRNDTTLLSDYKINLEDSYSVRIKDLEAILESDIITLPDSNNIEHVDLELDTLSNKIKLKISFANSFTDGDEIIAHTDTDSTILELSFRLEMSEDHKTLYLEFDYEYPLFSPTFELIELISLNNLSIKFKFYSYERARFLKSRSDISSQIGSNPSQYTPPWSNVENAHGYVTSYISDSIRIEF